MRILARSGNEVIAGVADMLSDYVPGLTLLRDYDEGAVPSSPDVEPGWALTIDEARKVIARTAFSFPGTACSVGSAEVASRD